MLRKEVQVCIDKLMGLLQGCIKNRDLDLGRQVHSMVIEDGLQSNIRLGCQLIRMFASFGGMNETILVFCSFHEKDVYAWTTIISVHVQHGLGMQAMILYKEMQISGIDPSPYTLVTVLKACATVDGIVWGKLVHSDSVKQGLEADPFVGSTLIYMYTKCSSLQDAHKVFEKLSVKDVVAWSAIITGYANHGHCWHCLELFEKMQKGCTEPNNVTFAVVLKACAELTALNQGNLMHVEVVQQGLEADPFVGCALVAFYSKCSNLTNARKVFDGLSVRNVVSWNTMISGYADHEEGEEALKLFEKMHLDGKVPNNVTFICILKACASILVLDQGRLIHIAMVWQGLEFDIPIGNCLIDVYAKCSSVENACKVFDDLPVHDVVSWTAMISGCVMQGDGEEGIRLFLNMQQRGLEADAVINMWALKACVSIPDQHLGNCIYDGIMMQGFESDLSVGSAVVAMYAEFGCLDDAHRTFKLSSVPSVVSWNALIGGCAEHGHDRKALELFQEMQDGGTLADDITFACILKACSSIGALDEVQKIHSDIINQGLESNLFTGSNLLAAYIKFFDIEDAQKVFNKLHVQDVLSWSVIIAGYAEHGLDEEVLMMNQRMQQDGKEPNRAIFVCSLIACSSIAALYQGKQIHGDVLKQGAEVNLYVGSAMVDMYGKCGSLMEACQVFDRLPVRDLVSWNAMVAGYADHGCCELAQQSFMSMQCEGIDPDVVTFMCLLTACSHRGLIEESNLYFHAMREHYGLTSTVQHYGCMVDILGRAGCWDEAVNLIYKMPFHPDATVWMTLLSSCAKYRNLELGQWTFNCLVKSGCRSPKGYVLMSNIYAASRTWND